MRRLHRSPTFLAAVSAIALAAVLSTPVHAHGTRIGVGIGYGWGHGWGPGVGYGGFRPGWGHGGWGGYGPRVGVAIGAPLLFGAPHWSTPYYGSSVVWGPQAYIVPAVPAGSPAYVAPPVYVGPSAYVGPARAASGQGQAGAAALPPPGYVVFSCPNAALVAQLAESAGRGGLTTGGAGAVLGTLVQGEAGSRMDAREQACIGQALELAFQLRH